ncbi:LOW QUALITY PROTEIN: hypothetical protein HID58_071114, partial [Brassica napus]
VDQEVQRVKVEGHQGLIGQLDSGERHLPSRLWNLLILLKTLLLLRLRMRVPEITEANEAIEANEATKGGEALSEPINAVDTELMHKTSATESKVAASPPNMKQVISLDRHSGYSMVHVYHEHDGTSPTTDGTEVKESESPFFLVNNRKGLNSDRRHTLVKEWINIHRPLFGAYLETRIQPNNSRRISSALPVGWKYISNAEHHDNARVIVVWHPSVTVTVYQASTTPLARSPWAVVGDFNQILQTSTPITSRWRLTSVGCDFLEPQQSDHAPCLFKMPSIARRVTKPFKFFHHVIDHPEYLNSVKEAWNCESIVGSMQFKLARSMKLMKKVLRKLNSTHYSGITQRVKDQAAKVTTLQCQLLTAPDPATARLEHEERTKWNTLAKAEEKFYHQRSRVRWHHLRDRDTAFYHKTVRTTQNHIHYLRDADDHLIATTAEIKNHAAEYFQGILRSTNMAESPCTMDD